MSHNGHPKFGAFDRVYGYDRDNAEVESVPTNSIRSFVRDIKSVLGDDHRETVFIGSGTACTIMVYGGFSGNLDAYERAISGVIGEQTYDVSIDMFGSFAEIQISFNAYGSASGKADTGVDSEPTELETGFTRSVSAD